MSTQVAKDSGQIECLVSVAIVLRDGDETIEAFLVGLQPYLGAAFSDYEVLLVHQGIDRRVGLEVSRLLERVPCVRFIELTPGLEEDVAVDACLDNAIGDYVVLWDPRRDPMDSIRGVVEACLGGSDVVVGVATQRETYAHSVAAPLMQHALRRVGYRMPSSATGLRCLSRRAVNSVTRTGRPHLQLFSGIVLSGYAVSPFPYQIEPGHEERKGVLGGMRKTMDVLVFNSTKPLRWMISAGLLGSLLAALIAAYSLLIHLFKHNVMEGWTSTVLFMSVLFTLQFSIMAFFGEYLGRLLEESSKRSAYTVAFEKHSSIMVDEGRKNVKTEARGESVEGDAL